MRPWNSIFSGQFMTRIPPELHRQASLAASHSGKSLNAWLSEQLHSAVGRLGMAGVKKVMITGKRAVKRAGTRRSGPAEKRD